MRYFMHVFRCRARYCEEEISMYVFKEDNTQSEPATHVDNSWVCPFCNVQHKPNYRYTLEFAENPLQVEFARVIARPRTLHDYENYKEDLIIKKEQ